MHRNLLIAQLHRSHPEFVRDRLKPVAFSHGDVLTQAGAPIERVIFPRSGLISLVVGLAGGERIEAATVGQQGALGCAAIFGAERQIATGYAQIAGSGWAMEVGDLAALAQQDPIVRDLLFRNEQYLLAQAQHAAACNAKHRISERLAKWLLRAQDECGDEELQITQEHLAQMLGVQRASLSVFAAALQGAGLVRYRRGRLAILDRNALERQACECYAALRRLRAQLFEAGDAQAIPAM